MVQLIKPYIMQFVTLHAAMAQDLTGAARTPDPRPTPYVLCYVTVCYIYIVDASRPRQEAGRDVHRRSRRIHVRDRTFEFEYGFIKVTSEYRICD